VLDRGNVAADGSPNQTITEAVLRRVFGVSCAVGRVPERAEPFVLPHGAQKVPGPE
jgi:ABC-type hemin transport system ATPase subunit